MVRDDKSTVRGSASNIEEIDIFGNADFMQAEQIFTADALPASSEAYAYTADNDDSVWLYGKETAASKIRLFKVTTGGADNPGAVATVFTGADATDLAYAVSPLQYFRQDNDNQDFLYYLSLATATVKLRVYDITAGTESENDSAATAMTLTGLDGSFDACFMKVLFGELFVGNGQYIAKVDKDGIFTEKAFTLPNGWEAVDIISVSDVALILARNINLKINTSMGFWWDLTSTAQVDDSFPIPWGGPQWVVNFREKVIMFLAHSGKGRFFVLSGAFPGAVPVGFESVQISNVGTATALQPISSPKMVVERENVLYFGLFKTDKTGVYALGQLDENKPFALTLSKRFHTTDYSAHKPTALFINGPNFYAAFVDNTTASTARCESNNSPTRSSNAVYETIQFDNGDPTANKSVLSAFVTVYPLAASTAVALSIDPDYSGSYTAITRADGTALNDTNDVLGDFTPTGLTDIKVWKVKLALTSSTTDSPKITSIGFDIVYQDNSAPQ
jgi:hypothetical protein